LNIRRLLTTVLVAVLAFTFSPVSVQPVEAAGCADAKLTFWEGDLYTGDGIVLCLGTNITNLGSIGANHACWGNPWGAWDWNDCISSFKYTETVNTTVCLYLAANYSQLAVKATTNGQAFSARYIGDFDLDWDNKISSIKWAC
jgi:hypothetical protein